MTSTTSDNPDRIEAEVEETRARLARTIEEIRDRMSPGQILDQAIDYARDSGGGEFTRNLGRQVRDNPLPILLIGAGIGWLMASDRRGRAPVALYDETSHPAGPGLGDRARAAYDGAAGSASSAGRRAGDAASSAAHAAGGAASSAYRSTADAIGGVAASVQGAVSGSASALRQAASAAGSSMSSAADGATSYGASAGEGLHRFAGGARRSWGQLLEEQPLVAGAIALAAGAALGAALPPSRTEDAVMGAAADRVRDRAGTAARAATDELRSTGREFGEDVKDTVDREGVSGAGIGAALDRAAEKVGDRLDEAADGLGSGRQSASASDGTRSSPGATASGSRDPQAPDRVRTAGTGKSAAEGDSPLRSDATTGRPGDRPRPG